MKALIADDSRVARRVLRELLCDIAPEIEADSAEDGEEAVAMQSIRRYDLIFLDVTMPKMNGLEALSYIRSRHRDVFVAMVSAREEERVLEAAARLGASAFLAKPFSSLDLQAALQLANGRSPAVRVLIIDDSRAQRSILSSALNSLELSCDVEEADDGPEGLRKALSGRFDIVFLDVNMPRLNGMDVLKEFKQTGSRAKVVMLSADVDMRLAEQARELGADACLPKPLELPHVFACVSEMLDVRRPPQRPAA